MITRREAIKAVALTAGALTVVPSFLQGQTSDSSTSNSTYPFKLAPLGYPYDALEPYIDTLTMQIHHDKHNGAYVENLNKAIAQAPESIQKMTLEELLLNLDKVPENIRTARAPGDDARRGDHIRLVLKAFDIVHADADIVSAHEFHEMVGMIEEIVERGIGFRQRMRQPVVGIPVPLGEVAANSQVERAVGVNAPLAVEGQRVECRDGDEQEIAVPVDPP